MRGGRNICHLAPSSQVVSQQEWYVDRRVSSSAGAFLGPGCTATHIRFQDHLSYYATVPLQPDVHRRRSPTRPSRPSKIRCERGTVCTLMADDANLEEPAGRVFRQVGARGPSKSADNMRKKGLKHFERFLSEKRLPPYEDRATSRVWWLSLL